MILAYYVHDLSPFLIRFSGEIGIRWYGLSYLAGFLVGILLYRRLAAKGYSDLKPDQVVDFITMGALFGVLLGGRLGYLLFYDANRFLHDPLIFFRVWEGGMASHGGIIGFALYTLWYARRPRLSFRKFNSPDAIIGGVAQSEPLRVLLAGEIAPRYPSQLIEASLEGVLLFSLLWFMRTKCRVSDGVLTGVFFISYALVRIFGECFREPDAPLTGSFTRGQFLSLFMILVGLFFLIWAWMRPRYRVALREGG